MMEREKSADEKQDGKKDKANDLASTIVGIATVVLSVPMLAGLIMMLGVWAALVFPGAAFLLLIALSLLAAHIEERPMDYLVGLLLVLAGAGLLGSYLMYAPDGPRLFQSVKEKP